MVLILDDESEISEFIGTLLSELGLKVLQSNSSKEALQLVKENNIDWIFTDIGMPGLNGIDLIKEIKQLKPDVKFVCVSAYADILGDDLNDLGIALMVQKPFDPDQFKKEVSKIILP